ncbi:hypothetical protein [Agromyces sp. GXS1127]|uniref:hypothetical protein n=1 Tax=Agromyces sp. GXS1127 TaxID=3424181 RepID=UPI003D30F2A5
MAGIAVALGVTAWIAARSRPTTRKAHTNERNREATWTSDKATTDPVRGEQIRHSRANSLVILGGAVILLLLLPMIAFGIASGRSQAVESAHWPDQPAVEMAIFMRTADQTALAAFASAIEDCVITKADESGSDALHVIGTPGWKASIERDAGDRWAATVALGALDATSFDGVQTELVDASTASPDCTPAENGLVEPLQLMGPLSYEILGPFSSSSSGLVAEDCAHWTTISGRSETSVPTLDADWLAPDTGKLTCTVDEGEPIESIHLMTEFSWREADAAANIAGNSSLLVLNSGTSGLLLNVPGEGLQEDRVVTVGPSDYEVAVHAGPGEEIVAAAPDNVEFGIRQYAKAVLEPGDGMLVRMANTWIRGVAGAGEPFIWMFLGVVAGLLPSAIGRVTRAFAPSADRDG